jgi:hypothetical protein
MDYTGNDATGSGNIEPGQDACLGNLTASKISVGECGNINYSLPEIEPNLSYLRGIIVSGGSVITVSGNGTFNFSYPVGLSSFLRSIVISDGDYSLDVILQNVTSAVNAQLNIDGATNTINLVLGSNGKIKASYSLGNSNFITLSSNSGWLLLGNNKPGGLSISQNNTEEFGLEPTYSGINNDAEWFNYKFNQSGNVYQGDLTVTGSLEVSTLISDIDVEDSIITLNKNGLNDDNTAGFVLNSFSNSTYSGFLKKDNSNNFYLFGNSNTLPTPVGWVPEQSGNLFVNSAFIGTDNNIFNPSKLTIRSQGGNQSVLDISCPINQIERLTIWRGINDIEVGSFSKDGEFTCNRIGTSILSAGAPVTFGNVVGPGNYTFPEFRGTTQQIMKLDNSGILTFEDNDTILAPNGTTKLQVFDDRIETNIKVSAPDVITDFIDALAANPLQIGAITAASVNIGKSGSDTVIEGGLIVKESLELGVAPNNYSVPVVKGLDKQFLQADANGDLQYGYHEFYACLQAENNFNLTLTNINQYYVPLNATIPFNSLDFSQSPPAGFTYNGTNSRIVKAEFHVAVEQVSAGSGNTINIRILVNNVPQSGRMRAKIDNTAPYPVEVSLSTCFLVSNGDIISGAIECETTSGLVIDIFSYSLVLTKT